MSALDGGLLFRPQPNYCAKSVAPAPAPVAPLPNPGAADSAPRPSAAPATKHP